MNYKATSKEINSKRWVKLENEKRRFNCRAAHYHSISIPIWKDLYAWEKWSMVCIKPGGQPSVKDNYAMREERARRRKRC